jgi:ABC-type transport system involved in multi-copper enzyme maturation permease subunit/ABC-type uncharacterized transport system involved in gliding motility auxiliary subunit
MKNALTVFRRDLSAFYTSPIGYIFMIVFLLMGVGLYITSFFAFPVADMRSYFSNLPLLLCVFLPAVTMRIWAEERKENTWEMLLTFPMKAWQLVLGKFLAVLAFYALTLAATFTVPLMLTVLGNPDGGAIAGGYIGAFLLGAFFLSIGIFISGLCRDQIVAFVVTLLVCFLVFLLGTDFIAAYIDGVFPGLGSRLSMFVGMLDHYNAFVRGVVELADVFYFVAWTVIFLFLNTLFIEGRSRPKAKIAFAGSVVLSLLIGFLLNWLLVDQSIGRFDLTEGKIYTTSPASVSILSDVKQPVQVNVYITPKDKMPTGLKTLEQDIVDKLDELRVASNGKLQYKAIHLEAANVVGNDPEVQAPPKPGEKKEEKKKDEKEALEERMLKKGVQPFPMQSFEKDTVTSKLVYSSVGVQYGALPEEIIPQVDPRTLPDLEYRLVSTVEKLTRPKKPVIALVATQDTIPPEVRQMYAQMGQQLPPQEDPFETLTQYLQQEKYDVHRVSISQREPLPDDFDALVILDPRNFNERQRWEVSRALHAGKPVILAAQNYEWDYQTTPEGNLLPTKREVKPGVNELLQQYGIGLNNDVLMDDSRFPLAVQMGQDLIAMLTRRSITLPTHILLTSKTMNKDTAITNRLDSVLYLWGSALDIKPDELKKHGLTATTLISTSDRAWLVPADAPIERQYYKKPEKGLQSYPVMAMVKGQFPDLYAGKPRPAWEQSPQQRPDMPPPPEEGEAKPVTPAPGKLLLIGASDLFRKDLLGGGSNLDLLMNSVDAVSLDERLVAVRSKKPLDRTIEKPSDATRAMWKFVNYALGSMIIAGVGGTVAAVRRSRRNAYTMAYSAEQ